jgi:hypothetical protein
MLFQGFSGHFSLKAPPFLPSSQIAFLTSSASPPPAPHHISQSPMENQIDEFDFPMATVARIAKAAVPEGTNFSKDARLALTKATSVFISYLTSAVGQARLSPQLIAETLESLGFSDIAEQLEVPSAPTSRPGRKPRDASSERAIASAVFHDSKFLEEAMRLLDEQGVSIDE